MNHFAEFRSSEGNGWGGFLHGRCRLTERVCVLRDHAPGQHERLLCLGVDFGDGDRNARWEKPNLKRFKAMIGIIGDRRSPHVSTNATDATFSSSISVGSWPNIETPSGHHLTVRPPPFCSNSTNPASTKTDVWGSSELCLQNGHILFNRATTHPNSANHLTLGGKRSTPHIAQNLPWDISGKSGCPGWTNGRRSAVRIRTNAVIFGAGCGQPLLDYDIAETMVSSRDCDRRYHPMVLATLSSK